MKIRKIMRNGASRISIGISLCVFSSTMIANNVYAQDSSSPRGTGVSVDNSEIIVTAQRREQSLIDVPAAITAVGGSDIKNLNLSNLSSITQQVPSFNVTYERGTNSPPVFNLRGIQGDGLQARLNESSIAIYVDDVFLGDESNLNGALFDQQRVEVLRGPQGTLFGKNTTGGLVHFISATPTADFTGYANALYGSDNMVTLEGAVSGPLSDHIRVRLAGKFDRHDGHYDNIYIGAGRNGVEKKVGDRNIWGIRGTVDIDLAPKTLLRVIGSYSENNSQSTPVMFYGSLKPGTTGSAPYTRAQTCSQAQILEGNPCVSQSQFLFGYAQNPERRPGLANTDKTGEELGIHGKGTSITAKLTHQMDWGTITSITNYMSSRYLQGLEGGRATPSVTDPTRYADVLAYQFNKQHQFSQEVRLNGSTPGFDWVAGGFFYTDKKRSVQDSRLNFNFVQHVEGGVNTDSYAAFGQVDGHITDKVTFTVGGRYTDEARTLVRALVTGFGLRQDVLPAVLVPNSHTRDFTGKLGVTWQPTADQTYYMNYSRGIKGVGYNNGFSLANSLARNAAIAGPVGQEVLDSWELGAKNRLFDRKLSINSAFFLYNYQGKQAGLVEYDGVNVAYNYINAGTARIYGFETEVFLRPNDYWDIRASGSVLRDQMTKSDVITTDPFGAFLPLKGKRLTATPRWTFNTIAAYHVPTEVGRFTLQVEANGRGPQYFDISNDPLSREKSHIFTNLRILWESRDRRFNAQAFVTNVFKEAAAFSLYTTLIQARGQTRILEGEGRLWGVKLGVGF